MNKVCYNIFVNRKNIGDNKIMAEQKATKKEYVTQENLTILQHIALEGNYVH